MLLLGHRGARRHAPENTFPAFDLALQQGADGFEFDVRLTGDHHAIICHDAKLHRLSVRLHTLKRLKGACPKEAVAPTLAEMMHRYSRKAFLNIELKVKGLERIARRAVREFPPERGYFISSFLPGVVRELHALDASLKLGTLADSAWQLRRWHALPTQYVVPNYKLLSRRLVEEVHAAGRLVCAWTVNEKKKMLRAEDLGVDAIISDDPRLLRETLRELKFQK